jgi:hypothetical protein
MRNLLISAPFPPGFFQEILTLISSTTVSGISVLSGNALGTIESISEYGPYPMISFALSL